MSRHFKGEEVKGSSLLLTFVHFFIDLINLFLKMTICFYLPVDFADYTAYRAVVVYIELLADFLKFFSSIAPCKV